MARKPKTTKNTIAPNGEERNIPVEKLEEIAEQAAQEQAPQEGQVQVNVDFLRTTKVHIAMPCYGGMLTESTFMSFIKWANTARQLGIDWTLETMVNESLISRARNTLTAKFLDMPDATHLFFVDAEGFSSVIALVPFAFLAFESTAPLPAASAFRIASRSCGSTLS
jgi:hypothetical protein